MIKVNLAWKIGEIAMNKNIKKLCLLLIMVLMITGCKFHSSKSYVFKVATGDNVKVTLDTSDGYDLIQSDSKFTITKDDEELSQGFFVYENAYKQYIDNIYSQDGITILNEDQKDNLDYVFYQTDGKAGIERNYIIWIKYSNTGIVLASLENEDTARKVFELLTFEVE